MSEKNYPLESLCAALAESLGAERPKQAAFANEILAKFVADKTNGKGVDRIFMYNPDAIATWIYEKYGERMASVTNACDIEIPFRTVMPSVTPVCFGTMYTGAAPDVHGIKTYVKPVISIDTLFDTLIRSGKKPCIVSTAGDSMSQIYLEREMDYYIYPTIAEVNAKAEELIRSDKYDFIAVYNGNYDGFMHRYGPESEEALDQLSHNASAFASFLKLIEENWKDHRTLVGFAMDHGCHEIDGGCGSHGLDMDEDMLITHLYKVV